MTKWLKVEDVGAYSISTNISDHIWKIVIEWKWFEKRTLGTQWVDSVDSISANIAEGFGRFHKKDKQKFYYNARGSVFEAIHWCQRAYERGLIVENEYDLISVELKKLPREINYLIKITQEKLKR